MTTEEDLRIIFMESPFVVTHARHVLGDDSVVRVFALLVKHNVCLHHVIDYIGL
jgi:hypothetical protein